MQVFANWVDPVQLASQKPADLDQHILLFLNYDDTVCLNTISFKNNTSNN